MIKYIGILLCSLYSCSSLRGQEYQWDEPFFVNINLGGDTRSDMVVDKQGNTYLMVLFENEVTILDSTIYSTKDNGILVSKFDENHNLIWIELIAEAKEGNPNQSRVMDNLRLEIDKENQFIYPVIVYTDSTYIDNVLYTVIQTETYYCDISVIKMNTDGAILDDYHFKGSCQTGFGGLKANGDYLYFNILNFRNNLDSDSVCSCSINSDTTIYSENKEAIVGRININNDSIDWVNVYNANGSGVIASEMELSENNIFISGGVESSQDLVHNEDTLIVPDYYSRYGYLSCYSLKGEYKWSKYFGVKGWDSRAFVRDLGINSNNDIIVVINLLTQSMANQLFFEDAPILTGVPGTDESFIVVNYDSLGNIKWHDISESLGYDKMISVDFDSQKNMYLAGSFTTDITFGSQFIDGYGFSNDILIISYDSLGNKRWTQKAGGFGSEVGSHIAVDSADVLHISGVITGSLATFGNHEVSPPNNGISIFVAQMKLEPLSLIETTPHQFGASIYPNPSLGNTTVEVVNEFISEIKVYNSLGQEVKAINYDTYLSKVNIENLRPGSYIIEIQTVSGKYVAQKLIVKQSQF